jgi:phage gpG-like protein
MWGLIVKSCFTGSEELTESVHTDYGSEVTSIATLEEFQSAYSDLGGKPATSRTCS